MTEREYDFYAEALAEREQLRITDSLHKQKAAQQEARNKEMSGIIRLLEADISVEREEIDRQKEINTLLNSQLSHREFWLKLWRKSAFICGGVIVAEVTAIGIIYSIR